MKTKRQVYIALTDSGRIALKNLSKKLSESQSDAAEKAIKAYNENGEYSAEDLARVEQKLDELLERL